MIRVNTEKLKESYDPNRIKTYMNKLGFSQVQTPLTYEYDYSGMITFQKNNWKLEFTYPEELLTYQGMKNLGGSCFAIKWADIKTFECTNDHLDIVEKNGTEIHLCCR